MINRTEQDVMKKWLKGYDKPMVSIRCTTYNQERYIAQAIESFLMQETNFPFEIIVHDDASADNTAKIIQKYEALFPKIIKPIYEKENQYSKKNGSLRKIVNGACRGKYVAYCEGDDFWCDKQKLQKQYDAMEQHPECSLCSHIVQSVSENGIPLDRQDPPEGMFKENIIEQNYFCQKIIAEHTHPLQTSSYFIRNSILQQHGSFFVAPGNGDEKILRISLFVGKIYFFNSIMSCYRRESIGSWTLRNIYDKSKMYKLFQNTICLNNFFNEYTGFRFNQFVELGNKKIEFEIAIRERQLKKLFYLDNISYSKKIFSSKALKLYFIMSKLPPFVVEIFFYCLRFYPKFKKTFKNCRKLIYRGYNIM